MKIKKAKVKGWMGYNKMAVPIATVSPNHDYQIGYDDAIRGEPMGRRGLSSNDYANGWIDGGAFRQQNLFAKPALIDKAAEDYNQAMADIELYTKVKDSI